MPQFMIAYHGGSKPSSKEEGAERVKRWKEWIGRLGDAVVNPGTPLPSSKVVTPDGVRDDNDPGSMHGFAVIKATSLDEAVRIAQSDPFLENSGTIRVSQMMEMP